MERKIKVPSTHLPPELTEVILLDLPIDAVLRFSAVSKTWNAMISKPDFAKKYRGDKEMIVLRRFSGGYNEIVCPITSIALERPADKAKAFTYPFGFKHLASCGHMWFVRSEDDAYLLYNPSIRESRQLPAPHLADGTPYAFGLGHEPVTGDYKIVKIDRLSQPVAYQMHDIQIYSSRQGFWTRIPQGQFSRRGMQFLSLKGVSVSGNIHWLITGRIRIDGRNLQRNFIMSFDISNNQFGEIEMPELPGNKAISETQLIDLTEFGGRLRVSLNHESCFTVWVMDYESKLWTKELKIDYAHIYPLCYSYLKPFYFYGRGGDVTKAVASSADPRTLFIYNEDEDGSPSLKEKDFGSSGRGVFDGKLTYLESFALP